MAQHPAAALTATAVTTSRGEAGMLETEAKANTVNSGPGGCEPSRSASSDPTNATAAVAGTASQRRSGEHPTAAPSPTTVVSASAIEACSRSRWTSWRSRPNRDANAPKVA